MPLFKKLQAEWRTFGRVKKSRSEAIWQRFRGSCDRFFARYAQRHDIARAERVAAREAICAELEGLAVRSPEPTVDSPESTLDSPRSTVERPEPADTAGQSAPAAAGFSPHESDADVVARVRDIRRRWQQEIAARGVDRERAAVLDDRFHVAFERVLARAEEAELRVQEHGGRRTFVSTNAGYRLELHPPREWLDELLEEGDRLRLSELYLKADDPEAKAKALADVLECERIAADVEIGETLVRFVPGGPQGRPELNAELFV